MLQLQHQTDLNALEEKFLMSSLSSDLQEERKANQRKIDLMTDELGEIVIIRTLTYSGY